MIKKTFAISGMHCSSCCLKIEWELEDIGVKARCSLPKSQVEVEYDPDRVFDEHILAAVKRAGYVASRKA